MSEKEVRKTTKQIVRKTTPKRVASKTGLTKKRVIKKDTKKTKATVARKAPTPVAETRATQKKSNVVVVIAVVLFLLTVGGSVAVGISGSGVIDIQGRLSDIKELATPEERSLIEAVPVQKTKLRDGGLIPSGVPEEIPAPEPIATSTESSATSTELIATSTQEIVSEETESEESDPDEQESSDSEPITDSQEATTGDSS